MNPTSFRYWKVVSYLFSKGSTLSANVADVDKAAQYICFRKNNTLIKVLFILEYSPGNSISPVFPLKILLLFSHRPVKKLFWWTPIQDKCVNLWSTPPSEFLIKSWWLKYLLLYCGGIKGEHQVVLTKHVVALNVLF